MFQQLVGINTIIYYAPTTLTNVGFAKTSAIYANLIIGVINVGLTVVAIKLIDRVGRKPLLFAGVVGMVASLLVLGISLSVLPTPHHPGDPAAIITLVCLATFIAAFAATWGPVVWVMIPEVLPLSVRGTAMGVAVFGNWAANFAGLTDIPAAAQCARARTSVPRLRSLRAARRRVREGAGDRDQGSQPGGDRGRPTAESRTPGPAHGGAQAAGGLPLANEEACHSRSSRSGAFVVSGFADHERTKRRHGGLSARFTKFRQP